MKLKRSKLIKISIVLVIAILIFSLFKIGNTLATTNEIVVSNVEVVSKSDAVDVDNVKIEDGKIKNNVTFHKVGDQLTYNITIKNNENKDYVLKTISDNNENANIVYTYEGYEGAKLEANKAVTFHVTITYAKEVTEIEKRNQSNLVTFRLTFEDEGGNEKEESVVIDSNDGKKDNKPVEDNKAISPVENNSASPKTGDNIVIYIVIASTSLVLLIILSIKLTLNNKKNNTNSKNKKKIIGLLLVIALVAPMFANKSMAVTSSLGITINTEIKFRDKIVISYKVDEEEKQQLVQYDATVEVLEEPTKDGYDFTGWKLEDGTDVTRETIITQDMMLVPQFEEKIPEKFDLRDKIKIKVADQKTFGICWDFACMKCVETNLALTQGKYYDFSEIYVDYLTSNLLTRNGRDIHTGGNFGDFLRYNLELRGFVLEDNLEYRDYDNEEYVNFANMQVIPISITDYVDFPEYRPNDNLKKDDVDENLIKLQKLVKKHVMNYGSVAVSMNISNLSGEDVNIYFHDMIETQSGHYMSIIGWDDKYPKENFTSPNGYKPKRDGAYIVLNSWGEEAGENGYVYVSYEDMSVHTDMTGVVSTSDEKLINLDNIDNKPLIHAIEEKYSKYIIRKDGHSYINKSVLNVLDLSNCGLTSIQGIDVFDKISELDLSNNNISNIEELKKLSNLYSLNLKNNKVENVSALKNLSNLRVLSLEGNVDVKGYSELSTLYTLDLKGCNINSIENLDKIETLEELSLAGNNFKFDNSIFSKLKLYKLDLSNCNLQIVPEIDATNLAELNLSGNKNIVDYSNLNNSNIDKLVLRNCDITDVNVLPQNINTVTGIQNLILNNCNINDVSIFNNMQLNSIDLSNNNGLYGNLNIKNLIVNNCNLDDSFNFFGNNDFDSLSVYGNSISFDYIIGNVSCKALRYNDINVEELYKIPSEMKLTDTTLIKNYKIPDRDNMIELIPIVREYSKYGNLDKYSKFDLDEYLLKGKITDSQGRAEFNYISSDKLDNCRLIINIIEDKELHPEFIYIQNIPKNEYRPGDVVDLSNIVVKRAYDNGYAEKISDYIIEGDTTLHEGENTFTIIKDGLRGTIIINCDSIKTIRFKTTELLNQICELVGEEEIEEIDYNNKTIVITKKGINNLRDGYFKVSSSMIDDIDSLNGIPLSEIFIEYDGHRIDESDIAKLSVFGEVTQLHIINKTTENNEDIIVSQDRFEISFINE